MIRRIKKRKKKQGVTFPEFLKKIYNLSMDEFYTELNEYQRTAIELDYEERYGKDAV